MSKSKFAMRTETHKLQHCVIRFSVDQHQVGFDVAVTVVFPVAGQRMVAMLLGQRLVVGQRLHDRHEVIRQRFAVRTFGLAFQITLELPGLFNRPQRVPIGVRQE